ncbi:MAG: hypothetical protein ACR2IE_18530 [Candidatus Sumerlaeaceae bacterium]
MGLACKQGVKGMIAAVVVFAAGIACAEQVPKYAVPEYTVSPDGRYGVSVPHFFFEKTLTTDTQNRVIDLGTSRVLGVIKQDFTAYDRSLNYHAMATPRWSEDSSLLLWYVEGKWFPDSYVLLRFKNGKVQWQRDLLKISQQEILARTRKASPKQYAAAKAHNAENGSAYPEGFSVDVKAVGMIGLPLRLRVCLSANPKGIDHALNLDSHLEAVVDEDGSFNVQKFALGCAEWSPFGSCTP